MTRLQRRSKARADKYGLQLKTCGKRLETNTVLYCTLPFAHYPTNIHSTIHLTREGEVVAVIDDTTEEGVESWLLRGAEESR